MIVEMRQKNAMMNYYFYVTVLCDCVDVKLATM